MSSFFTKKEWDDDYLHRPIRFLMFKSSYSIESSISCVVRVLIFLSKQ